MKKVFAIVLLATVLAVIFIPSMAFTEDETTLRMARVLYAMAGNESYETKLAIGNVIMNRVMDPWFPATTENVMAEKHQFPAGNRYDDESLSAARAVLSGRRVLAENIVYLCAADATAQPAGEPAAVMGGYNFYTAEEFEQPVRGI